ncbi:ABC transporter ATP-binding protein [Romboutsia sp.]|uniref:ABC transporter ATP-binding protein n=1 Tax=Romboutsia sp. TaxID=1965302 RepID=UPI003F3C9013
MIQISYIEFKNIIKRYKNNDKNTLNKFNLSINKDEFIVIVGPSGSGKSTLLELICGFEDITEGTIKIENKVINQVLPKDRDVSMVFQNYAILPHLTAYENIAFGMKIRKEKKVTIDEKVRWASKILELDEHLNKKPSQLSGGQRQRVAIARAMVREPKLFLMDEPLSNLDAKLRYSTCNEIINLHKRINATTIYVTHDQVEAMTMADRLVILNDGEIQQVGTPVEVYTNPKNLFVASFIGKPQINTFEFEIINEKIKIEDGIVLNIDEKLSILKQNKKYIIGIRPEHIVINEYDDKLPSIFKSTIKKVEYLGGETVLYLECENIKFTTKTYEVKSYEIGQQIYISFNLEKALIFEIDTKENIGE